MSYQEFFQELKKDHEEVTNLLRQMKSRSSGDIHEMVVQLKRELMPHQEAEEETFYKSLTMIPSAHRLSLKAKEEHRVAVSVLNELEKTPSGDPWIAKVDVLDELVQEHINEEESQAFAAARSLDEKEINDILQNFQRRKLQIKSEMTSGIKDEPDTRSSELADEDLGTVV